MIKKVRLILAVIILAISIYMLAWGYGPNPRVTIDRDVSPSEMRLPTPSSFNLAFEFAA